jgi:lipoprotein signal peptidase
MHASITSRPNNFMAYSAIKQRDNVTFLVIVIIVVVIIIIIIVIMSTEELGSMSIP